MPKLLVILLCGVFAGRVSAQAPHREVAVTFDDLLIGGDFKNLRTIQATNRQLLSALGAHHVPAIGFVNEGQLHVRGEVDSRIDVLRMWLDAGMTLGNHTFSHLRFQDTSLEQYEDDVIRGEVVTRALMRERGVNRLYFRYPFNSTGATKEAKEAFEAFLRARNYIVAPFTLELADYAFNSVYTKLRRDGQEALARRVRTAYLDFLDTMFNYFERRSREILRYEVKQILLIHVNELNAECMNELIQRLKNRGYAFITLDQALEDRAYQIKDHYVGPLGISWLHRWTVSRGMPMNYGEEPDPPRFVLDLYRGR